MVRVTDQRLKIPGSNPGSKFFFNFFFRKRNFFAIFLAQIRRMRRRMRRICENLQNLIKGANSTHRVLTQQICVDIAPNISWRKIDACYAQSGSLGTHGLCPTKILQLFSLLVKEVKLSLPDLALASDKLQFFSFQEQDAKYPKIYSGYKTDSASSLGKVQ